MYFLYSYKKAVREGLSMTLSLTVLLCKTLPVSISDVIHLPNVLDKCLSVLLSSQLKEKCQELSDQQQPGPQVSATVLAWDTAVLAYISTRT